MLRENCFPYFYSDPPTVASQQHSCSVEAGLVGLIVFQVHQLSDCIDAQIHL